MMLSWILGRNIHKVSNGQEELNSVHARPAMLDYLVRIAISVMSVVIAVVNVVNLNVWLANATVTRLRVT